MRAIRTGKKALTLGISDNMLKSIIPSPEQLKEKLNSLSYEQLDSLAANLDEKTLSQIKDTLGKKGE